MKALQVITVRALVGVAELLVAGIKQVGVHSSESVEYVFLP